MDIDEYFKITIIDNEPHFNSSLMKIVFWGNATNYYILDKNL